MTIADTSTRIVHAAGPKVIDAVENTLDLPANALDRTGNSLRNNGSLSSVSVLDILHATVADPPPSGSIDDRHGARLLIRTRAARLVRQITGCQRGRSLWKCIGRAGVRRM